MNRPIGHIQNPVIMRHHHDRCDISSSLLTIVRAVLSSDDPMVPEVLEVRMGFNPSSGNP